MGLYAQTLIGFCGVVIFGLMIWNADLGNLYYLLLLSMGLAAAGFVFGVFHSYALYSGKKLGRMLEVIGSVVAFLLVVIPVLAMKPPWEANELKRANEVKIGDEIFLRDRDENYVIAADISPTGNNWPRLGKQVKYLSNCLAMDRSGMTVWSGSSHLSRS